jgi:uncharacterized protein YegJ (DUF2314 family)
VVIIYFIQMRKYIHLLILLPFLIGCGNNESADQSVDNLGHDTTADTYTVTPEDRIFNSAITNARQTINELDKALESNNPSYTEFAVKKRFITPDDGGEHMWVAGITLVNGTYKGFVNNDAEKTLEVKYGDTVIVRKDEITDWMYLDNNVLRGGYTIRAVRNRLSKEERVKMDSELGFKVED